MRFGAPRHDAKPPLDQRLREHLRVARDLAAVFAEARLQRLVERGRLGGDHVHQRSALQSRKDRRVDRLLVCGGHQDEAAARAAQALVRGRGDDVGMPDRARIDAGCDQSGVMRHVGHQQCARIAGHLRESLPVDPQAVRRRAGDDESRAVLVRLALHRVVVDFLGLVQPVRDDLEPLARHVQRHAVRQVAALGEVHPHDRVAGLQEREEHRLVGLRARVRLHVRAFGAEELLHPIDRELFGDVDVLAAAVIALARIPLGVLVRQLAALRRHDGRARIVLRRDQLDVRFLPVVLQADRVPEFRV